MEEVNRIRLGQFRQMRREIRGSGEYLVVGIDVGKEKHHAFLGTAVGKTLLRRMVFENSREGFEKLLAQVEARKVQGGLGKEVFGLEPTANYHKPLADYLVGRMGQVVLVSGVAVKANRKSLDGRWDKHDVGDAANVADLVSQGKCLFYEDPGPRLGELRELLGLKRRLRREEHGYRVRIRNHLVAKYFPEMDRYYGQSKGVSLAVVRWGLNPGFVSGLEFEEFLRMVAPGCRNGGQRERVQKIWEVARGSVGCAMGPAVEFEVKVMVEGLKRLREVLAETEREIQERCKEFPEYECLLSIPGFGPDISAKVLGAIGDAGRFENEKQVLKLAGWDLEAERSGKSADLARPVISRKGKADLRYALYQAAMIASTKNQHFMVYFTNKLRGREREPGIKTKMRVKLAAKLLVMAWTLMKKKERFNPGYLNRE
jgi:transposase